MTVRYEREAPGVRETLIRSLKSGLLAPILVGGGLAALFKDPWVILACVGFSVFLVVKSARAAARAPAGLQQIKLSVSEAGVCWRIGDNLIERSWSELACFEDGPSEIQVQCKNGQSFVVVVTAMSPEEVKALKAWLGSRLPGRAAYRRKAMLVLLVMIALCALWYFGMVRR